MSENVGVRGLRRTSDPTTEPVTVEMLMTHLRLKQVLEGEDYLKMLIKSAREDAETFMRRALIHQSWTMTLDHAPAGDSDWWDSLHSKTYDERDRWVELPFAPLVSVTSVTTYDTDDAPTVVDVDETFFVDTNSEPGRIVLRSGQAWPSGTRMANRMQIVYKCGYGVGPLQVPEKIKLGILRHAAWEYEHHGDESETTPSILASGAASNYAGYRIYTL